MSIVLIVGSIILIKFAITEISKNKKECIAIPKLSDGEKIKSFSVSGNKIYILLENNDGSQKIKFFDICPENLEKSNVIKF